MRGREILSWAVTVAALALTAKLYLDHSRLVAHAAAVDRGVAELFADRNHLKRRVDRHASVERVEQQAFELLGERGTEKVVLDSTAGSALRGLAVVDRAGRRGAVLVSGLVRGNTPSLEVWISTTEGPPKRAGVLQSLGETLGVADLDPAALEPATTKITVAPPVTAGAERTTPALVGALR